MVSLAYLVGYISGVLWQWIYEIAIVLFIYGIYRKWKNKKDKIADWLIVFGIVGIVSLIVNLLSLLF